MRERISEHTKENHFLYVELCAILPPFYDTDDSEDKMRVNRQTREKGKQIFIQR